MPILKSQRNMTIDEQLWGFDEANIDVPRNREASFEVEDIYGFDISREMISDITDAVLSELEE